MDRDHIQSPAGGATSRQDMDMGTGTRGQGIDRISRGLLDGMVGFSEWVCCFVTHPMYSVLPIGLWLWFRVSLPSADCP